MKDVPYIRRELIHDIVERMLNKMTEKDLEDYFFEREYEHLAGYANNAKLTGLAYDVGLISDDERIVIVR